MDRKKLNGILESFGIDNETLVIAGLLGVALTYTINGGGDQVVTSIVSGLIGWIKGANIEVKK